MECPIVVTDTGLQDVEPCAGGICWPWYVAAWRQAMQRELLIAQRLQGLMSSDEQTALRNAAQDVNNISLAGSGLNFRPTIDAMVRIAKALRCLWFGAASRKRGEPPAVTPISPSASESTKKAAQGAWWKKWIPDLGDWAPSLSWPEIPGFQVALRSIWEKLKSWFRVALPWVLGGVALWLFLPTLVRSAKEAIRK